MGPFTTLPWLVTLLLLNLAFYHTDGTGLTLRHLCQIYGKGGIADPEASQTLEVCRGRCDQDKKCVDTIFISLFQCCLKYDHPYAHIHACKHLKHLPATGCQKDGEDVAAILKLFTRPTRKTTPRITTTTTTTTSAPPVETTEAVTETPDIEDDQGIPDPEHPERCEERTITGHGESWFELMAMLRNETAQYFCHKLCKAPPKPRYYWLKNYFWPQEYEAPKNCKSWGHYDSSLCAAFLQNFVKQSIGPYQEQLLLTVCSLPPAAEGATEASVTEESITGATGGPDDDMTTLAP